MPVVPRAGIRVDIGTRFRVPVLSQSLFLVRSPLGFLCVGRRFLLQLRLEADRQRGFPGLIPPQVFESPLCYVNEVLRFDPRPIVMMILHDSSFPNAADFQSPTRMMKLRG